MNNSRVRELRQKKGMKQEALGGMLGVSQQTISKIENSTESLSIDLLINISKYFNVTTDYILRLSDEKRSLLQYSQANKRINDYYDFILELEELNESNKNIVLGLMRALKESQTAE